MSKFPFPMFICQKCGTKIKLYFDPTKAENRWRLKSIACPNCNINKNNDKNKGINRKRKKENNRENNIRKMNEYSDEYLKKMNINRKY